MGLSLRLQQQRQRLRVYSRVCQSYAVSSFLSLFGNTNTKCDIEEVVESAFLWIGQRKLTFQFLRMLSSDKISQINVCMQLNSSSSLYLNNSADKPSALVVLLFFKRLTAIQASSSSGNVTTIPSSSIGESGQSSPCVLFSLSFNRLEKFSSYSVYAMDILPPDYLLGFYTNILRS